MTDVKGAGFDTLIEWLVVSLLLFMPLAFGVVHAWSEEIVLLLSGAILICFLLKHLCCRRVQMVWNWAYLPVGVFLIIVLIQLIPFPSGLLEILSPRTVALKNELLGGLSDSSFIGKTMTITFYKCATTHLLRLLLSLVAVFFVVVNVFRDPDRIKRLLMRIALIGGGIALLGLAQQAFGNGKIYWVIAGRNMEGYSGPFLCHSHYGQFMNLSMGAALAWVFVTLHEKFAARKLTARQVLDYLFSPSARPLWLLIAIITCQAVTVFASLTRGGMISMLAAGTFTMMLLTRQKSMHCRSWIMVTIALAAFTCVLYVGFDAVYDRLATLRDLDAFKERWQIVKDLGASFRQFPLLGTGLGTHAVIYPMFQTISTSAFFTHAENEYAQVLEETGLAGLLALLVFGVIIWIAFARNIRKTASPIHSAAYGLGFGLLAVLIHSLTDFGQHLPSNAFLSAVFCALLVSMASRKEQKAIPRQNSVNHCKSSGCVIAFLVCSSALWLWMLTDADHARRAEAHWAKAVRTKRLLAADDWRGSESQYRDLISQVNAASAHQPGNVKYRYWLSAYRWYSIVAATQFDAEVELIPAENLPQVRSLVDQLHAAIQLCPTFGPAYTLAGRIEESVLADDNGADKIRKGFQLAPSDPTACFEAALLDIREGKIEAAVRKFEKAVQSDSSLFKYVVDIYLNELSRPHLAIAAAGNSIMRLDYMIMVLEEMQYDDLAARTAQKLHRLLQQRCLHEDVSAGDFALLAKICRTRQLNEQAVQYYHRALDLDYGQVHWRFTLARLLAKMNRTSDAMQEARICLRLKPRFDPAKKLIDELSVNPVGFDTDVGSP